MDHSNAWLRGNRNLPFTGVLRGPPVADLHRSSPQDGQVSTANGYAISASAAVSGENDYAAAISYTSIQAMPEIPRLCNHTCGQRAILFVRQFSGRRCKVGC